MAVLPLLSGCGASAARPAKPAAVGAKPPARSASHPVGSPKKLKTVNLRLAFLALGWADPFALAEVRGYYRKAGFNVHILQSTGSAITGQTVANGQDQFGVIDAGTAAGLISKGASLKMVAVFVQQSPEAFIHNPGVPVRTPRDLIGKTVISSAGASPLELLPAVLGRYGVRESQFKLDLIQPSAQVPAFKKDPKAVLLGLATGNYPAVLKADPKAQAVTYGTFGISMYNIGLATNLNELKNHPAEVRRFVAASVAGWQAAARDPAAAVDATLKLFPNANRFIQTKGLDRALKMLHTPATKGHPLGWMARSDWVQALHLLHVYGGMKPVLPVSSYYTDLFLPSTGG